MDIQLVEEEKPKFSIEPIEETPGFFEMMGRGATAGTLDIAQTVGTGLRYMGTRTGIEPLKKTGEVVEDYWARKGEQFAPPEEIQGSILEKPGLLKDPAWWAYNVANVAPSFAVSIIPAIGGAKYIQIAGKALKWTPQVLTKLARIGAAVTGGATGGSLEGANTYQEIIKQGGTESEAATGMELMTLASAGLNALSLGTALTPGKIAAIKHILLSAGVESATEYLEEPAEVAIKYGLGHMTGPEAIEQLKQGVNVIPPTFVTGGLGGRAGIVTQRAGATGETKFAPTDEARKAEEEQVVEKYREKKEAKPKITIEPVEIEEAKPVEVIEPIEITKPVEKPKEEVKVAPTEEIPIPRKGEIVTPPVTEVERIGKPKESEIQLLDEELMGSHHGQKDLRIQAVDKSNNPAGRVEYSLFNDKIHINWIEVPEGLRQKGIAKQLIDKVRNENPGLEVEWGMTTPEGTKLREAIEPKAPLPTPTSDELALRKEKLKLVTKQEPTESVRKFEEEGERRLSETERRMRQEPVAVERRVGERRKEAKLEGMKPKEVAVKEVPPESPHIAWFEKAQKRILQEEAGKSSLEDIIEKGTPPKTIADEFWDKTYWNLPQEVQSRFKKQARSVSGFKPGDTVSFDKEGNREILEDWIDVGKNGMDWPNSAEYLESTERGYIVLMDEANKRFGGKPTEAVKPRPAITEKPPEVEKPPTPEVKKEPWELTKSEIVPVRVQAQQSIHPEVSTEEATKTAESFHRGTIKRALDTNKPVPKVVLDEYPGLVKGGTKEPWEMDWPEWVEFWNSKGDSPYSFAEKVGKPLGIKYQAGNPFQLGTKFGQEGSLPRDRWRRAIVEKAISEKKIVPDEVMKDYPDLHPKEAGVVPESPAIEWAKQNRPDLITRRDDAKWKLSQTPIAGDEKVLRDTLAKSERAIENRYKESKAPEPKPAPSPVAKLSPEIENTIRELRDIVSEGTPRTYTAGGNWVGSSYPPFMSNKGWVKKEVLQSIDKGLKGEKLFTKQQKIFDAAVNEAKAIVSDRAEEGKRQNERQLIIDQDPGFLKEDTIKSLTKTFDDEIIGMKEELREQGHSEDDIAKIVEEARKRIENEERPSDVEGIKAELSYEGIEEPPVVKEPVYSDYERTIRAIPITRGEALQLQGLFAKSPNGGSTRAVFHRAGPEVTGIEGWYLKDLGLYEGKNYGGKKKTIEGTKAQRDLHNSIRSDLDRVSEEVPNEKGVLLPPEPMPPNIPEQRILPGILKSETGAIQIPTREEIRKATRRFKEFWSPLSTLPQKEKLMGIRSEAMGDMARVERIVDRSIDLTNKLSDQSKLEIFEAMDGRRDPATMAPENAHIFKELNTVNDIVGKMLVERGLISDKAYLKHKGQYIKYAYLKHVLGDEIGIRVKPNGKLDLSYAKARKDLTIEQRKALGLIEDVSVAEPLGLAKSLGDIAKYDYLEQLAQDPRNVWKPSIINIADMSREYPQKIARAQATRLSRITGDPHAPVQLPSGNYGVRNVTTGEMLGRKMGIGDLAEEVELYRRMAQENPNSPEIAKRLRIYEKYLNQAKKATQNVPEDFIQMPTAKTWGPLAGSFLRKEIARDLMSFYGGEKGNIQGISKAVEILSSIDAKATGLFKVAKVPLNLPTVVRNTVSNVIQLNMSGMNSWEIPKYMVKAGTAMIEKAPEYTKAFRAGLFKTNWSVTEINEVMDQFRHLQGDTWGDIIGAVRKVAKYYGKIDDFFKFAKYLEQRDGGASVLKAASEGQKWGMDYSLADPAIKWARKHFIPFVSYQYKIAPLIVESAIKRPWVIGKYLAIPALLAAAVKTLGDMKEDEWEELKKTIPEEVTRRQSYAIIPWKMNDRWYWFDYSYFLPWGNYMQVYSGLAEGDIKSPFVQFGVGGTPMITLIKTFTSSGLRNEPPKDAFSGYPIYSILDDPLTKALKTSEYLYNQFAPSMLTRYGALGYSFDIGKEDRYGRYVPAEQAVGKWVGVNLQEANSKLAAIVKASKLNALKDEYLRINLDPKLSQEMKEKYAKRFQVEIQNVMGRPEQGIAFGETRQSQP